MLIDNSFFQSIDGAGNSNFVNVSGSNGVSRNPSNRGFIGYVDEYRHLSRFSSNDEVAILYNYGHS
jgi:hypothetical protein